MSLNCPWCKSHILGKQTVVGTPHRREVGPVGKQWPKKLFGKKPVPFDGDIQRVDNDLFIYHPI